MRRPRPGHTGADVGAGRRAGRNLWSDVLDRFCHWLVKGDDFLRGCDAWRSSRGSRTCPDSSRWVHSQEPSSRLPRPAVPLRPAPPISTPPARRWSSSCMITEEYTGHQRHRPHPANALAYGHHDDPSFINDDGKVDTAVSSPSHSIRVVMDELLVGNYLETVACRAAVDDTVPATSQSYSHVPLGTDAGRHREVLRAARRHPPDLPRRQPPRGLHQQHRRPGRHPRRRHRRGRRPGRHPRQRSRARRRRRPRHRSVHRSAVQNRLPGRQRLDRRPARPQQHLLAAVGQPAGARPRRRRRARPGDRAAAASTACRSTRAARSSSTPRSSTRTATGSAPRPTATSTSRAPPTATPAGSTSASRPCASSPAFPPDNATNQPTRPPRSTSRPAR